MKKTILSLLALFAITATPAVVMAQTQKTATSQNADISNRQAKRAMRQAENEAIIARVAKAVNSHQFTYIATELSSSGFAAISNIKLNQLWDIRVTPQSLYVYLPIYGAANPFSQPSIFNRLDFTTNSYSYDVQPMKNGGSTVTIKATDQTTNRDYTFVINVSPMGQNSTLMVNSTFTGPVTFMGNINYTY
ncbi:MAG: DUF4251 domain-containing protein [Rikenellaceae bacterium]|nr:DUF4251 domain-containing protein [Rikenellaceae bacterium]MDE7355582.1 DUF4251 domain-containing protein [Rikenellaceae bacterium]